MDHCGINLREGRIRYLL